jgi:hypothetical protein
MATSPPQDSELAHSFGPQEIGFDYLPLELSPPEGFDLRTQPAAPIPVVDLASDGPLALPTIEEVAPFKANGNGSAPLNLNPQANGRPGANGKFWLEGDVLMCACPDCQAPMSVRLWLMIADCWRCGASIELTEEQEREVQRLLEQRRQEAAAPPVPRPHPPAIREPAPSAPRSQPRVPLSPPVPAALAPPPPPAAARQRAPARRRANSTSRWLNNLLRTRPPGWSAWWST